MPKLASIAFTGLGGARRRGLAQPARDPLGVEAAGAREHDGELVAAQPVGVVAAAQAGPQGAGEQLERHVAGLVAERVVQRLEVVHVAEDEREVAVGAPARLDLRAAAPATRAGWAAR